MAYELKTKKNDAGVEEFIAGIEPDQKQQDCLVLLEMMRDVTGDDGAMWGAKIVGFGKYSYKYASGHSGEWFLVGFSPPCFSTKSRVQSTAIRKMRSFPRWGGGTRGGPGGPGSHHPFFTFSGDSRWDEQSGPALPIMRSASVGAT